MIMAPKTVYKYPLYNQRETIIEVPLNAKPLRVRVQNGVRMVWIEHDLGEEGGKEKIEVIFTGTGWTWTDENLKYIDTLFDDGYIWHYYWRPVQ